MKKNCKKFDNKILYIKGNDLKIKCEDLMNSKDSKQKEDKQKGFKELKEIKREQENANGEENEINKIFIKGNISLVKYDDNNKFLYLGVMKKKNNPKISWIYEIVVILLFFSMIVLYYDWYMNVVNNDFDSIWSKMEPLIGFSLIFIVVIGITVFIIFCIHETKENVSGTWSSLMSQLGK